MRLYLLLTILTLLPSSAMAATFVSEEKMRDVWDYKFSVKSSALALPHEMGVSEYDCNYEKKKYDGKPLLGIPTNCFNTEEEARVDAQKQADKFEKNLIASGMSTTEIETKRLITKVLK